MNRTSWHYLQHGNLIKSGDEQYIERGLQKGWILISEYKVGKKYDAASMQPIRRKKVAPLAGSVD